jgi:hypothetical protein
MDRFNQAVKPILDPIHSNLYIKTFIILFLSAYPALARPELPSSIEKIFEKPLVRFVLIAYIVYDLDSSKNIYLAIIISLLFLIIIHQITNKKNKNKTPNMNK